MPPVTFRAVYYFWIFIPKILPFNKISVILCDKTNFIWSTKIFYHPIKGFKKFPKARYLQKRLKFSPSTLFSIPPPCVCSTRTGTAEQNKKPNYNLQRPQIFKSSKTLWMCLKRIFRHSNLFLNFEYRNGCDLATVTVSVQHHYVPSSGPLPTFTS